MQMRRIDTRKRSHVSEKGKNDTRCGGCAWLTERYNLNYKGEPVLGRCCHSEYAVLLSGSACENFKMREDEHRES